jgi:L-alanine-DL-glutamate epimerase-like enolase superfamily enzyme
VNTHSRPSDLVITDLRVTRVAAPYDYILIKIYTNQDVYGLGESHESSHIENVLQYKSILLGQNPLNVDMLHKAMKPHAHHGTQGGGISGIEMALWDLIGRVYGVPCYQFFGGKYRDRVRLYADTPSPRNNTPEGYAQRVAERKAMGLTLIKFDTMLHHLKEIDERIVIGQPNQYDYAPSRYGARGLVGTQVTQRYLDLMVEIVAAARKVAGPDIPLALDHFGPLTVKDGIRMGRALEGYGIAWLEDIMSWEDWKGNKKVTDSITVPTALGEQVYLLKSMRKLIDHHAMDIMHPDMSRLGGLAELKRTADYAEEQGIPTVLHCAGSPVMFMANIHMGASIRSLIAQEIHSLDIPFWRDLVTGLPEPFMEDGYVKVPDKPGLGVELNEEVIKEHLRFYGYFDPSDDWNLPKLGWWIPKPGEFDD